MNQIPRLRCALHHLGSRSSQWRTFSSISSYRSSVNSELVDLRTIPVSNSIHNKIHIDQIQLHRYSTSSSGSNDDDNKDELEVKQSKEENPGVTREFTSFQDEIRNFRLFGRDYADDRPVPKETDIVVIGGGSFGLSVAYWLKQRHPEGFHLTVVERDPSYTRAATTLSVASIRHQFSLKENIEMSMFSSDFLKNIRQHLSVLDLDPPDIMFNHQGYLLLAGSENASQVLQENHELQLSLGARIELLKQQQLQERFPWLNTSDLTLGTYGLTGEGWFDPWLYLTALKIKCLSLGVKFVKGEVTGFSRKEVTGGIVVDGELQRRQMLEAVEVRAEDSKTYPMKFAICVNCAGPWAGEVGRMAGIGAVKDGSALSIPIPIEPRKRFVYVVHCPDGPGLDMPMLIDSSGVYMRREGLGGHYICGTSPKDDGEEPDIADLDVDFKYFDDHIWPHLAHRIPSLEKLKVKSGWAGFYDYNYFDQNLIIGNHPYFRNFMIAAGCSGHGVQQSPAIGRAVAEYILDGEYETIDLRRFSFDRILEGEPVFERMII